MVTDFSDRYKKTYMLDGKAVAITAISLIEGGLEVKSTVAVFTTDPLVRRKVMGAMIAKNEFEFQSKDPISQNLLDESSTSSPLFYITDPARKLSALSILDEMSERIELMGGIKVERGQGPNKPSIAR
jgi:hypothetical protein